MRNRFLYVLFVVIFCHTTLSGNLKKVPIFNEFHGVISRNDTIMAYGSSGVIVTRYDKDVKWETRTVFKKGSIEMMFWEKDRIVAFNNLGDVAVSEDNSQSWSQKHVFDDTLFAVVRLPQGYCIRTKHKLFTIDNDYNYKNEYPLFSRINKSTWPPYPIVPWLYRYSLAWFQDHIIAETENAKYIMLDSELNPVDTLSFSKMGLCSTCNNKLQMRTDSNNLYFSVDQKIFRTKDLVNFETIFTYSGDFILYKPNNGVLSVFEFENDSTPYIYRAYTLDSNDSITRTLKFTAKEFISSLSIQDLINIQDKIYVFGEGNYISEINMQDSSISLISYMAGQILDKLDDSTLFFINDQNLLISTDNGTTIKPNIPWQENAQYCRNVFCINFQRYDKKEKTLYLGATDSEEKIKGIYSTKDFGRSFRFDSLPAYHFIPWYPRDYYKKLPHFPYNLQIREDAFVTSSFSQRNDTIVYTRILTFDKQFKIISNYRDSGYVVDYVNSKDTNSFLVHCLNVKDNAFEIKYTSNRGVHWDLIKKYKVSDSMFRYTELEINNKPVLFMLYFCTDDSMYSVEALDVEKRTVSTIYQYKIEKHDLLIYSRNQACVENDTVYLAIEDTIFYTTDIYDRSKWKYFQLPDGGCVQQLLCKLGNKFWACYSDTINTEWKLYWFVITPDSAVSVVERPENTEETYLYTYPPKPMPASNSVRSLIYFDPRVEFDLDKVGVVDVSGAKIDSKQDINLERLTPYSGYLTWDCSGVNSGVYFIHIRHGNNARVVKVIVSK